MAQGFNTWPGSRLPGDASPGRSLLGGLSALVVVLAATLPYLRTLGDYFIGDDFGVLWLLSSKPPLHVLSLFTMPWTETVYGSWTDELRPTLALTLQWDWFWGR